MLIIYNINRCRQATCHLLQPFETHSQNWYVQYLFVYREKERAEGKEERREGRAEGRRGSEEREGRRGREGGRRR